MSTTFPRIRVSNQFAVRVAAVVAVLSLSACGSPTSTPTPTPAATPTSTPTTPSEPASVWHVVEAFPPAGTALSAISSYGTRGFVIAGSADAADTTCPEQREARIWTSSDGLEWREINLENASNATADLLPAGGQGWPVIGRTGSSGCPGNGPAAWAPTDDSGWHQLTTAGLVPGDEIVDIAALQGSDDFVATGQFANDSETMGAWTMRIDSTGSHWQRSARPPPSMGTAALTSVAAIDDTVIGFDGTPTDPAWYSLDAGETWTNSDFKPSYRLIPTDARSGPDGFVATGRACCGLPGDLAGVVVRSVDGRTWTEAREKLAFAKPIEAVASTGVGWIALGEENYLSVDGIDWHAGPPLPGYQPQAPLVDGVVVPYRLAVTAGEVVVAISPTRVWVASTDDLTPDRWPVASPYPAPVVGGRYEHTLLTHCGPHNGPLYFNLGSWVPDLPQGYFPTSFDSYYEHGILSFVAADRLEFTGRKSDIVVYHPTDDPPASFPCA
jgi:hypothetical protein